MKFVADVNISQSVIKFLRRAGHNVIDIKRLNPLIGDKEIINLALEEKRIVLTHDKDFLVLTQYPKFHAAIILIKLEKQNAKHFRERLKDLLKEQPENILNNSLTILEEDTFESYPYPQ